MKRRGTIPAGFENFLIGVAFWVLVLASAMSIGSGNRNSSHTPKPMNGLSLSLTQTGPRFLAERTQAPASDVGQQAITAWQGPIVPVLTQTHSSATVVFHIPTTEPVIFVGIDDGWVQSPENQQWLLDHHLPFTLFLTDNGIKNNYDYFKGLQNAGMTIEDHTQSHGYLTKMTAQQQKKEICHTADTFEKVFGQRPTLFRPPYGAYNDDTRKIAAACGIRAIVLWDVVIGASKGGDEQFQPKHHHLQPGDIVLMHFQDILPEDMQTLINDAAKSHLQIGRLEDWIR